MRLLSVTFVLLARLRVILPALVVLPTNGRISVGETAITKFRVTEFYRTIF